MMMVEMKTVRTIPVRCGKPYNEGAYEDDAAIPAYLLEKYSYVLRAEGSSMEPTISSGSLLIVEGGGAYKHGSLVIVQTNEGIMVKRYDETKRLLVSDNPVYPSLTFELHEEAKIIAVVKHILISV
jgi:SOS-response transcriptional repressor LexA